MIVLLVRAADQIRTPLERFIYQQHRQAVVILQIASPHNAHGTEISRGRIEQCLDLGFLHRTRRSRNRTIQLRFIQLMIAAHQHHNGARRLLLPGCIELVGHESQRLDLVLRRHSQEFRDVVNRLLSRSMHQQRLPILESRKIRHLVQFRCSLLQVSRVIASIAAHNPVFPGRCAHHEFMRLLPSHRPRVRLHHHVLQPAAVENPAVRVVVLLIARVQAGFVQVKRVGILHHELSHAQQPGFWARFIAKLGLNLIPDLRKLLVAAQFFPRDLGHVLFVRHRQTQFSPLAVFQAEQVVAHHRPAAAAFPQFARM